ncbi:MAG: hypothetical protein WCL23_03785 [Candidatus Moraniibacteriota bacterium]
MNEIFENLTVSKKDPKKHTSIDFKRGNQLEGGDSRQEYTRLSDDIAEQFICDAVDIEKLVMNLQWIGKNHTDEDRSNEVRALARLVLELRNDIGTYDTIVSDDASGRLPALFLHDIAGRKRKLEGKKDETMIYFVAGGQSVDSEGKAAAQEFVSSRKASMGRLLLVTELVISGESIRWLADIFMREGLRFDIACVSSIKPADRFIGNGIPGMERMRYGSIGDEGLVFTRKNGNGVEKMDNEEFTAKESHLRAHPKRNSDDYEAKRAARADMKYLAQELSKLL